jgi:Holliday junction DNA helicase RuvB
VAGRPVIDAEVAAKGLDIMDVDSRGLDMMDRKILECIIDHFGGGPVGVKTIAAACSEEVRTIEDIYEPYLIQCGFLKRTPRGRWSRPRPISILTAGSDCAASDLSQTRLPDANRGDPPRVSCPHPNQFSEEP